MLCAEGSQYHMLDSRFYRLTLHTYHYFRHAAKMDTPEKHAMLENLAPGATYELVVKAGNSNGTSQLTSPLKFVMAKNYIVQTTNQVRRWT